MIFDLVQAFDSPWSEDSFIEFYKYSEVNYDKLSLLFELNQESHVSTHTPVGQTKREMFPNVIMQRTIL